MTSSAAANQMADYLVPETVVETHGAGPGYDLGDKSGKPLLVVLRVTEVIEQQSLLLSVWGSADGKDWGKEHLFQFPERFYRGVTPASLDMAQRPEVKFLQARWEVNRWGRGYPRPIFKFSLEIQALNAG
jgi:hypothetical protein